MESGTDLAVHLHEAVSDLDARAARAASCYHVFHEERVVGSLPDTNVRIKAWAPLATLSLNNRRAAPPILPSTQFNDGGQRRFKGFDTGWQATLAGVSFSQAMGGRHRLASLPREFRSPGQRAIQIRFPPFSKNLGQAP